MKYFLLPICAIVLFACKNVQQDKSLLYDLSSAKDAFDYPDLTNKSDTDILVYQLKDTLNQQDSFLYVNEGTNDLKKFNEPNLSLRPMQIETFRFSYYPSLLRAVNITFDKNKMVVKIGATGFLSRELNYDKLDSAEKIKLRFLEKYFFRSRESMSEWRVRYYDSMLAIHPELKSIRYYKKLIDKSTDEDSAKFTYTTRIIPLSPHEYKSIIDSLKKTDFDKLLWKYDPHEMVNDGGGYVFEANTKHKYKYFLCAIIPVHSLSITGFCKYLLDFAKIDKKITSL